MDRETFKKLIGEFEIIAVDMGHSGPEIRFIFQSKNGEQFVVNGYENLGGYIEAELELFE